MRGSAQYYQRKFCNSDGLHHHLQSPTLLGWVFLWPQRTSTRKPIGASATSNAAFLNVGARKAGRRLPDTPHGSVGLPTQLLSSVRLWFMSWMTETAYWPGVTWSNTQRIRLWLTACHGVRREPGRMAYMRLAISSSMTSVAPPPMA